MYYVWKSFVSFKRRFYIILYHIHPHSGEENVYNLKKKKDFNAMEQFLLVYIIITLSMNLKQKRLYSPCGPWLLFQLSNLLHSR
jgi:hypothetical protein